MSRGFTLLEVLLAIALTAMVAGAGAAIIVPLSRHVPAMAQRAHADAAAHRFTGQIALDLLVEHESLPRQRVSIKGGVLSIVTRDKGVRLTRTYRQDGDSLQIAHADYKAFVDGVRSFAATLEDNNRLLVVTYAVGDGASAHRIRREYRLP